MSFLIQASHGPYYVFFTIHLDELGYASAISGGLWALGVIAEIILFIWMPALFKRFGLRWLLLLTLGLTSLRWLLMAGFAEYLGVLLFTQCLHGFSFGVYHAIAMALIQRFFRWAGAGPWSGFVEQYGHGFGWRAGPSQCGLSLGRFRPCDQLCMGRKSRGPSWVNRLAHAEIMNLPEQKAAADRNRSKQRRFKSCPSTLML